MVGILDVFLSVIWCELILVLNNYNVLGGYSFVLFEGCEICYRKLV